jgi:hypothetical protein
MSAVLASCGAAARFAIGRHKFGVPAVSATR